MTDPTRIETLLRTRTRFPFLHHVASCVSTQDLAAQQPRDASGNFVEGVFWADHQTRGRGRQQREWHDEPGADLAVTFRVHQPLPSPLLLAAAVPVAVAEAVEPVIGQPLRFKWPNDVYLDGRKLCGVLLDAGVLGQDTWLVGIGVNCNRVRFPPELEPIATSIAVVTGREVDRGDLLLSIAQRLDETLSMLTSGTLARMEEAFRTRLGVVGKRVEVEGLVRQVGMVTELGFGGLRIDAGPLMPLGTIRAIRGIC